MPWHIHLKHFWIKWQFLFKGKLTSSICIILCPNPVQFNWQLHHRHWEKQVIDFRNRDRAGGKRQKRMKILPINNMQITMEGAVLCLLGQGESAREGRSLEQKMGSPSFVSFPSQFALDATSEANFWVYFDSASWHSIDRWYLHSLSVFFGSRQLAPSPHHILLNLGKLITSSSWGKRWLFIEV